MERFEQNDNFLEYGVGLIVLGGLYLTKTYYSHLLFHSLVEFISIIIASAVFLLAWNSRRFVEQEYHLILGIGYLFSGAIDLLHTLAYKGMVVFPNTTLDIAPQFWLTARYLEAFVLFITPAIAAKKLRISPAAFFTVYFIISAFATCSILWWRIFPQCYVEGVGLTQFKIINEYIICSIFAAAAFHTYHYRHLFTPQLLRWLFMAIAFSIASDLLFTLYIDIYGFINFFGHCCKLISYYFIYKAIIEASLLNPYESLFRGLHREIGRVKKAEEKLRHSEERFELAMQGATDGLWDWNILTHEVYYSPRWKEMLGYAEQEIASHLDEWQRLTHPDDQVAIMKVVKAYLNKEISTFQVVFRMRHKYGHYIWILGRGIGIWNEKGKPMRMVGTHMDLTRQIQAEEALRKSEERFELAMRGSSDGLWDLNYKTDEVYYSPRFKQIIGFEEHESLNVDQVIQRTHPEDLELMLEMSKAYLERKIPSFQCTFRMRHKNGHYVWVLSRAIALWDKKGYPLRMVGTQMDLTAQKQTELALQENKKALEQANVQLKRFKTTLDMTLDSVFMVDTETLKFSYVNLGLTNLLGYSQEELLTMTLFDLETGTLISGTTYKNSFTLPYGSYFSVQRYETEYRHKNGYLIAVEVFLQFVQVIGQESRFVGIIRDITERKRTEIALLQAKEEAEQERQVAEIANRAKSTFLANMSHELRTPLNGILGYTQILMRDGALTTKQREGVAVIHRSGEYLLTLINDILDLSKIEAQRIELYPADFRLDTFLKDIVELFQMRVQQKGINLIYEMLSDLPLIVHGDETRLRQILINLLSNAVKFTAKGYVKFKVSYHYDKLRFQVEDTGMGIAAADIEKIFLPFEQVGDPNYKTQGTGLGLSITKKLVELMGGKIHVESTVRRGSIFWVILDLPAILNTKMVTHYLLTTEAEKEPIGYEGWQRKILVVDDHLENCEILVNLLTPLGFKVIAARNGKEAIITAQIERPDLILMDLLMPEMDGLIATSYIRAIPELAKTPIIAISASVLGTQQQNSKIVGCDDFIAKPFALKRLFQILDTHLQLVWIYKTQPSTNLSLHSNATTLSHADYPMNREQAMILFDLAKRGDIDAIIAFTQKLERIDSKMIPFAVKIRQMTDPLQKKKICEIAKYYMDNPHQ